MIKNIIFDWQGVLKKIELNRKLFEWIENNNDKYVFSILSNYTGDIVGQLKKTGNLSNFETIITPKEYSLYKPDQKIFNILLKNINGTPNESLFIDDSIENIKAAKKLNFKAIHYKNNLDFFKKINNL
jgi:FMN phosphatase YigB (HAD superfamily)